MAFFQNGRTKLFVHCFVCVTVVISIFIFIWLIILICLSWVIPPKLRFILFYILIINNLFIICFLISRIIDLYFLNNFSIFLSVSLIWRWIYNKLILIVIQKFLYISRGFNWTYMCCTFLRVLASVVWVYISTAVVILIFLKFMLCNIFLDVPQC